MREEQITGGGSALMNYMKRNNINNIMAELKDYGFKGENEMEEIKIRKVLNGYIVEVGCETLVFNDIAYMLLELKAYLLNPKAMKEAYMKKYRPEEVGQVDD